MLVAQRWPCLCYIPRG